MPGVLRRADAREGEVRIPGRQEQTLQVPPRDPCGKRGPGARGDAVPEVRGGHAFHQERDQQILGSLPTIRLRELQVRLRLHSIRDAGGWEGVNKLLFDAYLVQQNLKHYNHKNFQSKYSTGVSNST